MKPSLAKHCIRASIAARKPLMMWGPPGVCKSQLMAQVSAEDGLVLHDVRLPLLEPVDLRGLPYIAEGVTKWARPTFFPSVPKSVLFLDELPSAEQSTQAACYQLVLDFAIGEYRLPDDCAIVCAGNRAQDRAHTNRMPTALANRLVHVDIEPDLHDWARWAVGAKIRTDVLAFIMFRPDLLHKFDPKTDDRAFASPRSWETVSRMLDANPDPAVLAHLVNGTVGEGAGTEFSAFQATYKDLPNPKVALMNPATAKLPTTPAGKYAICTALAHHVDELTVDGFFGYVGRLDPEFQVLAVKLMTWKKPNLAETRAYIEWGVKNQGVFIA